jgi:hypothetical protein
MSPASPPPAERPPTKPALVWEEAIGPVGTFEAEMACGGHYHVHPVVSLRRRRDIRREDIVSYQVWVVLRHKRGGKKRINLGNVPTFQQAKEFCERDYLVRRG